MKVSTRVVAALVAVGVGGATLASVAAAQPRAERFATTICHPPARGVNTIDFNGAPVSASQPVAVSISEGFLHGEGLGDARMTVENVTVVERLVKVRINVQWGEPLPFCLHYVG
ncbi:hypothetical protein C8E97_4405 [Saccharothrix australiensis]|uniref:ML domain-containing protein n=2 Tax=Saccharothrix australiensis TaxID=2072 RepID=A0A495W3Q1_9PSEU|nr:hypothetical protein C8E97_4405 [Saccharothrix australiensis]